MQLHLSSLAYKVVGASGRTAGLAVLSGNCNSNVFRVSSQSLEKVRALYYFDQNIHFEILENAHFLVFLLRNSPPNAVVNGNVSCH